MRATVIIPTYNRPERLAHLLTCLARQGRGNLHEVLVCDDGSSTDTWAAIAPFAASLPSLRLLRQEDQGFRAGQARNMGIRTASGELLLFLDDDLLLPDGFVAQHVAAHRDRCNGSSHRRVVLGFRHRSRTPPLHIVPTLDEILASKADDRVEHLGLSGERLPGHPQPWFFIYSCNFSVPNRPEEVLFDESFEGWGMEDTELGYRLVRAGYQVMVQPAARVLHLESHLPRDPFICEDRGLEPRYDSYVGNMVQLIDKYPDDPGLRRLLSAELRWYVRDESGQHWIKDGHEHDAEGVIHMVRQARLQLGPRHAAQRGASPPLEASRPPRPGTTPL